MFGDWAFRELIRVGEIVRKALIQQGPCPHKERPGHRPIWRQKTHLQATERPQES